MPVSLGYQSFIVSQVSKIGLYNKIKNLYSKIEQKTTVFIVFCENSLPTSKITTLKY